MKYNMKKKLLIIPLLTILLIISVYAGTTKFYDLGEITEGSISESRELRHFEAYRFKLEGNTIILNIDEINPEYIILFPEGNTIKEKHYRIENASLMQMDFDEDGIIDAYLEVDNITVSNTKKRVGLTISNTPRDLRNIPSEDREEINATNKDNNTKDTQNDTKEIEEETIIQNNTIEANTIEASNTTTEITEEEDELNAYETIATQLNNTATETPLSGEVFKIVVWSIVLLIALTGIVIFIYMHKKRKHYFY